MGGFAPLTRGDFRSLLVTEFQAALTAAGVPLAEVPDTGPDSVEGARIDSDAALAEQLQYQAIRDQLASRLGTTPANPDGSVSADALSFADPFGVDPTGGSFASSSTFRLSLGSVANIDITIPCGLLVLRSDGLVYVLVADAAQPHYNGAQGYTIPAGAIAETATLTCLTAGSVGNVNDPTAYSWQVYTGPNAISAPALASVTNDTAFTNATDGEAQEAFKSRFRLTAFGSRSGTRAAIAAAILSVAPNLTYALRSLINANGEKQVSHFCVVVNQQGGGSPPGSLITDVATAIDEVRSLGDTFEVIPPVRLPVAIVGNLVLLLGTDPTAAAAAATAAILSYLNGVGLDQYGNATTASQMRVGATVLGVPNVVDVTGLTLNGIAGDITAPFGQQLVAGTITLTTSFAPA